MPRSTLRHLEPHFVRAREVLDKVKGPLHGWAEKVCVIPRGQRLLEPSIPEEIVEAVYTAVLEERQFRARYRTKSGEEKEYLVHPLGLVLRRASDLPGLHPVRLRRRVAAGAAPHVGSGSAGRAGQAARRLQPGGLHPGAPLRLSGWRGDRPERAVHAERRTAFAGDAAERQPEADPARRRPAALAGHRGRYPAAALVAAWLRRPGRSAGAAL